MEFYTRISIPKAPFTFSHTEQTVLLGSCFAENIGKKLEENKFRVDLNPFGTLYNPASIAEAIRMLLRPERFTGDDLSGMKGFTIASAITVVSLPLRKRNAWQTSTGGCSIPPARYGKHGG